MPRLLLSSILLIAIGVSACSHTTAPSASGPIVLDSLKSSAVGTTLIFSETDQYFQMNANSKLDTTSNTYTTEIVSDSIHCHFDRFKNATWWRDVNGSGDFIVNYLDSMIQFRKSSYIWTSNDVSYSTFRLSSAPSDYREIFRLDTVYTDSINSSFLVRDSVRSLGVEYLPLAGERIQTIHFQEQATYAQLSNLSIYRSQTLTDLWFAPSLGFFVMEDRILAANNSHSHLELIAFSNP